MSELSNPAIPVGQSLELPAGNASVPPEKRGRTRTLAEALSHPVQAVGQAVLPLKREEVGQLAMAQASAPFALTRSGATPALDAAEVARRKRLRRAPPGREHGGPACIGCHAYRSKRTSLGAYTGHGYCVERDRDVTAVYRGACGLYEFYAVQRQELRTRVPSPVISAPAPPCGPARFGNVSK